MGFGRYPRIFANYILSIKTSSLLSSGETAHAAKCNAFCGGVALAATRCLRRTEVIRVGFIGCVEGRASDIGIASRNAVQMAFDDKNEADGINGREIELLVRDDKGTSEGGPHSFSGSRSENNLDGIHEC